MVTADDITNYWYDVRGILIMVIEVLGVIVSVALVDVSNGDGICRECVHRLG
jgi:hypothetical protein